MVKIATLRIFLFLIGSILAMAGAQAQCPPAATCTPGRASNSNAQFIQAGIYSVRIGNNSAHTSGGYSEGYVDNSCTIGATLIQGDRDSLVVLTGAQVDENVRVYIDWNNNGTFETATELAISSNGAKVHRGAITAPGNAVLGQKLRVRIAADANIAALPTACSTPEYSQAEDYYVQVQANTAPPIANFFTTDTLTCSGTASFRDQSSGSPTSWAWSFGDGGTSQDQNPSHTYTGTGRYTVTLIATNANGSDTLTRPNYVYYNDTVPVAASCTPVTSAYCCGFGITRFTLKNESGANLIDKASANGSAGYENFTCTIRAKLIEGRPYSVALATNPSQVQNTKIWIDFNDNGSFDETSELVFSSVGEINPTDTFTILGGAGSVRNRPLRMRVLSDGGTTALTACTNPQLGQAEDYTVVLLENTLPPVANFSRVNASGCDSVASFTAEPENIVTTYIWDFGDGNSDTTTTPSVSHEYNAYGLYTVSLVVEGPFGRDTLTKANYVSFIASPAPALCDAPTGQSCCQIGIRRVQIADIDMVSGDATEGYKDFTCQATTTLKKSRGYPITVVTGANNPEMVGIWIDWNNDQNFADDERVFDNTGIGTHTGSLPAMPANVVMNTALRMRVASGAQQGGPGGQIQACGPRNFGQAEDYTVVVVQNLDPPIAAFGSPRSTCNGSITFADSSQNEVSSWLWRFGDGDTSTQQNPTHIYTTPGVYTVTLVVRNDFGIDSIVKTNFITVYSDLNLAPVSCQPAAQNPNNVFGISRVRLNTIDNASDNATEGYKDFTCSQTTRLTKGSHYNLRLSFSSRNFHNSRAWIDYNSNGIFETAEILGTLQQAQDTALINFTVPGSGTEGRGLRMRIICDFQGNNLLDPCNNLQIGQAEDYTILLDSNQSAPVAAFGAQSRESCNGFIQFLDSSNQVPTSYRWDFGDGTFSTLQNPVKKYTSIGTYTVKLVVRNSFGADSLVRNLFVNITGVDGVKLASCRPTRTANNGPTGITRVRFATFDNFTPTNGQTVAYEDYTCPDAAELLVGTKVPIEFQVVRFNERVFGWIDWNNDSTFTTDEQVVATLQNAGNQPRDTISVPATAVRGKALRFRLISTSSIQIPTACGSFTNGQMEEYAVIVNAREPIANFELDGEVTCSGSARFLDSTQNGATAWNWSFGDNTFSTEQNPVHTYATPGTYTVTLIVSNPVGTDTIIKTDFVTVGALRGPKAPACIPTSTLSQNSITGMVSVTMNNLNRASSFTRTSGLSTEGYRDFACSDSVMANIGDRISVTISPRGANRGQVVSIFLDANNDGTFTTTEQMAVGNMVPNGTYSGAFTVPTTLTDTIKYRIRVIARASAGPTNTCAITDGQAEDYMLGILPTAVQKPVHMSLFAYPNPASNSVKITLPADLAGTTRAEIVDGLGRIVMSRTVAQTAAGTTFELSLTQVPQGYYTLRLTTAATLYTTPLSIVR